MNPLLIVGHGTKSAAGVEQFAALVDRVRLTSLGRDVEGGFLELAPPPIQDAVAKLAAAGHSTVDVVPLVLRDPNREVFQQLLFSKIVPNCKKLGLLDRNDSWLRRRYEEMGVIQFEDWADTGEEYTAFALDADAPAA